MGICGLCWSPALRRNPADIPAKAGTPTNDHNHDSLHYWDINLPHFREEPMEFTKAGNATGQEPQGVVHCACGMENPLGRRFCTHCGTSLAEPCSLCGEMALVDQRFCGNCGAELATTMDQKIK